jgi:hypothetical protein
MARRALPVSLYNGVNTSPAYPFRVSGISADVIAQYRHLSNEELQKHRVIRLVADEKTTKFRHARPQFVKCARNRAEILRPGDQRTR